MAYTKQLWANGDIITAAKMNHMEDGIDAISANGAIGTSNLANASVTNAKLDQGAVDTSNIANGAVGTTEIQDGAVTSAKLADSAYHNTAATFDTTKAYSSGDYCVYNGALYRFTADKAAGAWDSTKVVAVALADDVDEVKSEIQKINAVTLYNGTMTNGSVSKTTGENLSSSSLVRTSWVDVSNIEKLIYSRIYTTSS